jgi:hypothetical protein
MPSSPSSLKYTAFLDVSVGGFGWISFFSQGMCLFYSSYVGGDNTNKKYNQLMDGMLIFNNVMGFDVYIKIGVYCSYTQDRHCLHIFLIKGKSTTNKVL